MWKQIESIGWNYYSQKPRGYDDAKLLVVRSFSQSNIHNLRLFVKQKYKELEKRIRQYERITNNHCGKYGGDDSFMDMVYHVIGMGELKYKSVMENPSLLDNMDFVESFVYCIPSIEELPYLEENYHKKQASHAITELTRIATKNNPNKKDLMIIEQLMSRFLSILAGDYITACKGFDRKKYKKYSNFEANDCLGLFSNYLIECKAFMLK